jgi:hypothetical protein
VFFAGSDGTMTAPGHVGIVVRDEFVIDVPQSGENVQIQPYTNQPDQCPPWRGPQASSRPPLHLPAARRR